MPRVDWKLVNAILWTAVIAAGGAWTLTPSRVPLPPAPPIVSAEPELVIVTDDTGKRIDDKAIETVAGKLATGVWHVQAIPKPGDMGWTRTITVSDGVKPVPGPPAPVPPIPSPTPAPAPSPQPGAISVLIVEETGDKMTRDQLIALHSPAVRSYLNSHCRKGPDGTTPDWRMFDKDTDLSREDEKWRRAMTLPKPSVPCAVVTNGVDTTVEPITTEAALLALLTKWGGA